MADDKTEYRDESHINVASDVDQSKVPSTIKKLATWIRQKMYGEDVRESIARGIEKSSEVAQSAVDIANDTANRQDEVDQSQKEFEDRYNDQVAGNTDLEEVIDARKPKGKPSYIKLGQRLDDMPSNEELELLLGDDNNDVDGGIRDYMKPVLTETLAGIDTTKFNLGFGTDYHYDVASDYNPQKGDYTSTEIADMWRAGLRKSLNLTSLSTKLDAVVFGGDNADQPNAGTGGRPVMVKEQQDFANTAFSSTVSPTFILKGNHDCNYNTNKTSDDIITDNEIATIYRQNDVLFGENRLKGSNYFYKDFTDKKVRLIGLDMYDLPETFGTDGKTIFNRFTTSGLQQTQLNWLANDALLTVPADYTVLITAHCSPDGTLYTGAKNHNHIVLKTILEAFVTGTSTTVVGTDADIPAKVECKFTNAGHLAGVMFGHWHKDDSKALNGVNYIGTRCSLTAGDEVDEAERMAQFGTANEDAFDIATIDSTNKLLTLKRVGAGSDTSTIATRTFSYE